MTGANSSVACTLCSELDVFSNATLLCFIWLPLCMLTRILPFDMTLTDMTVDNMENSKQNPNNTDIGCCLRECLQQASSAGRLTCGVFECAKLLNCNPDDVMMCILPAAGNINDVTVHIQHTLMEAFCWENDIRLIKVDSATKLANILNGNLPSHNDNEAALSPVTINDVTSLLLELPKDSQSTDDKAVCDYFERTLNGNTGQNMVIELPV